MIKGTASTHVSKTETWGTSYKTAPLKPKSGLNGPLVTGPDRDGA